MASIHAFLVVDLFVSLRAVPPSAGLFADDDARKQVQQLEGRVVKLEQALAASDADKEQYVRSMLDLQMQMEAVNTELRKMRGQNEEFAHDLQDAEKRQKDFYIDLDTRLRHIEAGAAAAAQTTPIRAGATKDASADTVARTGIRSGLCLLQGRELSECHHGVSAIF